MGNKTRRYFPIFFILLCFIPAAHAQDWTGNLNMILGTKILDDTDWDPVDLQREFGVDLDFRNRIWHASIAIDYLRATKEESGYKGETTELNLGVRYIWETLSTIRPFLGGGYAMISGEFEGPVLMIDDSSTGM